MSSPDLPRETGLSAGGEEPPFEGSGSVPDDAGNPDAGAGTGI